MTISEFSNQFDILYNNITSNQAPGLSEYEKSVFLTKAQDYLVTSIYDGNIDGNSFEGTEEMARYIEQLTTQIIINTFTQGSGITSYSVFASLPSNLWFIVYESALIQSTNPGCLTNGKEVLVTPVTHDQFNKIEKNPFRGASINRVLRISSQNKSELISKYPITQYKIRYIRNSNPIILEDLSQYGLTIKGQSQAMTSELNNVLHNVILDKAVALAQYAWGQSK
mgnify:FL=1